MSVPREAPNDARPHATEAHHAQVRWFVGRHGSSSRRIGRISFILGRPAACHARRGTRDCRHGPITGDQLDAGVNRVTDITYDRVGRKTTETGPAGNQTTYVYDDSGRVLTETRLLEDATNPNTTAVTSYDYQDYAGAYPLVAESRPDGVSITHTYDWVGNETKVTDPRNAELGVSWDWQTVYDAQDRITESWTPDPDGGGTKLPLKTITSFSVLPFQTTVTDPAGVKSVTQMDVLGRVTVSQGSVSATGGLAPTYTTYDGAGNVKRVEQKDASKSYSWIEHTYNAYGQVLTDKAPWRDDANGATFRTLTATHEYYPTGLPKKIDGPLGLDFSTTNPNEAGTADPTEKDVTTYDYNLEGWMKSATYWTSDVKSWTTDAYYNDAGEQTQLRTQLTGGQTPTYQTRRWTYTPAGLVAGSTEFHGTAQGAPCQGASTPGKCTTSNTYDEGGRLISTTDDRPCTVTNTYDLLSQLTDRVASGSGCSGNEHFAYWANGAQKQAKQNATGAASTFNMEYDFMGRPTYVKKGATTVSSYAYKTLSGQETGQLDSVTTSGVTTSYGWCAASSSGCFIGLLQTVDEPLLSGVTTYTYEAAGRVETRKDVNGTWTLTWERKYEDQTGRSNTQTIKKGTNVLGDFDVDYDEAGNIIKRKENVGTDARNSTWTYGYDAASRMISATGKDPATTSGPPTLTWNYAYDGAGNRISATKPSGTGTISYTLDGQGWPVSDDNGAGTKYAYDPVGDLTLIDKDGTTTTNDWSFTFDAWSRTTQARKGLPGSPTLTVDYQIDALGRMGRRTTGGSYVDY